MKTARTTIAAAAITASIASSAAVAQTPPEIALTDVTITDVQFNDLTDIWVISFDYTFENVGEIPINFQGFNPGVADDIVIQTWVSDTADPFVSLVAAGGDALSEDVTLDPGETFSGSFQGNTNQLPDPANPGDFSFLVVGIQNVAGEPSTALADNRLSRPFVIPSPAGAGLFAVAGVAVARRRR